MNVETVTVRSAAPVIARTAREQQAMAELGHTRFSQGVRHCLVLGFLLTIVAVPLIENVSDVRRNLDARRVSRATGIEGRKLPGRRPRSFDLLDLAPSWQQIRAARSVAGWLDLLPPAQKLRDYEDTLVLNSAAIHWVRPWTQWVLTRWFGVGSATVDIGRDGWLFYRDGVEYVTGPGFLDPQQLKRRASAHKVQPDPRTAIVRFRDDLRRRGIALILFPVPDKAMIRPGSIRRLSGDTFPVPQNSSWGEFVREMTEREIPLLDLAEGMADEERQGRAQYLKGDTHWSPTGVEFAARTLATFVDQHVSFSQRPASAFRREDRDVELRMDDLIQLLELPVSRADNLFRLREHYRVSQVHAPSGRLWEPDPTAEILVIGDSYMNAYSEAMSGDPEWPASGLAEQLSYYLQRPLDAISAEGGGPYGSRAIVKEDLLAGRDRLNGKKAVVWEFAVRELSGGDWRLID